MRKKKFILFRWFDDIPGAITNGVTIASGVVTIISGIVAIIEFLLSVFFPDTKLTVILDGWPIIVLSVSSTILGVFGIYKMMVYRDALIVRTQLIGDAFAKININYKCLELLVQKSVDSYLLDNARLLLEVRRFCQTVIDNLCEVVSEIVGYNVYGCVKIVDANDEDGPQIVQDQTVSDFVRSEKTPDKRRRVLKTHVLVRKNTDFLELMDRNCERFQFYQPSLLQYVKRLKEDDRSYQNTTPNWDDEYRSTSVVPIFETYDEEATFTMVLGFLCLDAKDEYVFSLEHKQEVLNLQKACADKLFGALSLLREKSEIMAKEDYKNKYIENLTKRYNC